jgi:cell division protein FtsL
MYSPKAWVLPLLGAASSKVRSEANLLSQHRRYIQPPFFRMGPAALSITCMLLVGFMAVLYLSQVGQGVAANHQLQDLRNEQAALERQNQDLAATVTREQSPAYIIGQAQKMGLDPVDPQKVWIIQVAHLQEIGRGNEPIQP